MKETNKLVHKIKRLLRRAGLPRWLHHFGPKKYEFWEHARALLIRTECQLGYRRVKQLLDMLGIRCPSKSALHLTTTKVPGAIWNRLLAITKPLAPLVGAMDSTTFARSNPSYHYLQRIDRKGPTGIPVKLSCIVDTRTRKVIASHVRIRPRADVKEVLLLLNRSKPKTLVADKEYDSEAVHKLGFNLGIKTLIPSRKNVRKGFYRRKMRKEFNVRTYHRRSTVESVFSALKQRYGGTIRCHKARTIRAEVSLRLICHNILSWLN